MTGHKLTIESDGTEHGTKATLDGREIGLIAGELVFQHKAGGAPFLRIVTHPRTNPPMPDLTKEEGACIGNGDDFIHVDFGIRR